MTDDIISAHVVAAMLGLDAAERAAASRAGTDSVEEWSRAWGGVVTAQRALSAAAGPNLSAQAAAMESLEAGDCAEYLRACVWALETIGHQEDMPELMVARAYVEDVAREVAAISAKGSTSASTPPSAGARTRPPQTPAALREHLPRDPHLITKPNDERLAAAVQDHWADAPAHRGTCRSEG